MAHISIPRTFVDSFSVPQSNNSNQWNQCCKKVKGRRHWRHILPPGKPVKQRAVRQADGYSSRQAALKVTFNEGKPQSCCQLCCCCYCVMKNPKQEAPALWRGFIYVAVNQGFTPKVELSCASKEYSFSWVQRQEHWIYLSCISHPYDGAHLLWQWQYCCTSQCLNLSVASHLNIPAFFLHFYRSFVSTRRWWTCSFFTWNVSLHYSRSSVQGRPSTRGFRKWAVNM